jgi:predicted RNA-binding Zn-ribbon protein involved in translation (DUF1610 family)
MAGTETKQVTRAGTCETHGTVQAVKELPVFRAPGLFWAFRYLRSLSKPYRCPECGAKVSR